MTHLKTFGSPGLIEELRDHQDRTPRPGSLLFHEGKSTLTEISRVRSPRREMMADRYLFAITPMTIASGARLLCAPESPRASRPAKGTEPIPKKLTKCNEVPPNSGPRACVAAHGLAELYAVLTTLPVSPRITAGQARKLIRHNIASRMDVVALDGSDYQAAIELVTNLGLTGGIISDALHLRAAEKAGVDRLMTFNRRDFERLAVETRIELVFL